MTFFFKSYVFLACQVSAEESKAGSALAVGARVMWVNLNRIVIDIFITPEHDASVNFTCNFPFQLSEAAPAASYSLRTFCPEQLLGGEKLPVSQTAYADLAFVPVTDAPQTFVSGAEDVKPMAELANSTAGLTISAYSSMDTIQCASCPAVQGVCRNQTMGTGVSLKADETLTGRVIYGFDRLYTQEEMENPAPTPFGAFF